MSLLLFWFSQTIQLLIIIAINSIALRDTVNYVSIKRRNVHNDRLEIYGFMNIKR